MRKVLQQYLDRDCFSNLKWKEWHGAECNALFLALQGSFPLIFYQGIFHTSVGNAGFRISLTNQSSIQAEFVKSHSYVHTLIFTCKTQILNLTWNPWQFNLVATSSFRTHVKMLAIY